MNDLPGVAALALAALCAGVMGFAIQRGGTCTVAAVEQLVGGRGCGRLAALAEASLWVAGGLVVARALHALPVMPAGYALTAWTLLGGALLGLGALVNRACVFGALARFGSGEWAYAAMPVGFYVGCLAVGTMSIPVPVPQAGISPVLVAPAILVWPFVAFLAWRSAAAIRSAAGWRQLLAERLWTPHAATVVIGVTFLATLFLAGAWAYTDVLAELAHGMAMSLAARGLLALALLMGAVYGGMTAGRRRRVPVAFAGIGRCFVGGVLMGCGSLLIPGGNDGLILVGVPLLWPYAWAAFATMCLVIALSLWILGRRARRRDLHLPI